MRSNAERHQTASRVFRMALIGSALAHASLFAFVRFDIVVPAARPAIEWHRESDAQPALLELTPIRPAHFVSSPPPTTLPTAPESPSGATVATAFDAPAEPTPSDVDPGAYSALVVRDPATLAPIAPLEFSGLTTAAALPLTGASVAAAAPAHTPGGVGDAKRAWEGGTGEGSRRGRGVARGIRIAGSPTICDLPRGIPVVILR